MTDSDDQTVRERRAGGTSGAPNELGQWAYEDEGPLGSGGMGEVRACRDTRLGRTVAIKTLRTEYAADAEMLARFLREATVQGMLDHPAVVPLYDIGVRDGAPFFTMKRVRGSTLKDLLEKPDRRQALRKLLAALSHVAVAVHYAHVKGILHRDLKPANIMFGDYDEVYVLDWGISASGGEATAGTVSGTVGYMAPEQLRGETVDVRSDVYALGVILFEIVTGSSLHGRQSEEARAQSTLAGVDIAQRINAIAPDTAPELVAIIDRACALVPSARFVSALELHLALERYLDGDRDLERRRALSIEHSTAAASAAALALRTGSLQDRRRSLRDVGRALAYDAENGAALRILVDLLAAPPEQIPADVHAEWDARHRSVVRQGQRYNLLGTLALAALVPVGLWIGVIRGPVAIGLLGLAAAIVALRIGLKNRARIAPLTLLISVGLSMTFFSLWTAVVGPFLAVPTLIALVVASISLHAPRRVVLGGTLLGMLAILVPLGLEWTGVVAPSYRFVDGMFCVVSRGGPFPELPGMAILVGCTLATLGVGAATLGGLRAEIERNERAVFLHAWQLRQMISDESTA